MTDVEIAARTLAEQFHEIYERLAPSFGYETRQETQQFDPSTPNGRLMIAVCGEIARERAAALAAATPLIEARVREEVLGVIYDIRGLVIEADDLERITHVEALHQIDTLASKALVADAIRKGQS